jgi:hypothetical protein
MTPVTEHKAARILAGGRLKITSLGADGITAICLGDTADSAYEVGQDPGGWRCSCPARRECSHIRALKLVTVFNLRRPARTGETE